MPAKQIVTRQWPEPVNQSHQIGIKYECPRCYVNKLSKAHVVVDSKTAFMAHVHSNGHPDVSATIKFYQKV